MQDRYAALVKGPSALFPRGFLWLIPACYAGIAAVLVIKGKPPLWFGGSELGGLLLAAATLLLVLATMRNKAFVADNSGIWLGLRADAIRRLGRRRGEIRQVPWPQIERLKIVPRSYGARLDVALDPAAPVARHGVLRKTVATFLLVIFPPSFVFRSPGLLTRRGRPPRYRIPLHAVTADELALALAQLAPATVSIEMPRGRVRPGSRPQPSPRTPSAPPLAPRPALRPATATAPAPDEALRPAPRPVPAPAPPAPRPLPVHAPRPAPVPAVSAPRPVAAAAQEQEAAHDTMIA